MYIHKELGRDGSFADTELDFIYILIFLKLTKIRPHDFFRDM